MSEREQLEQAIAHMEAQRLLLGDGVVDAAVVALRKQLQELEHAGRAEQRKVVSLLFMDTVGSTVIVRDLDPEENLAIMDAGMKRLSAPIERHGGHVTRYMGDGFKAVFGLPVSQENDAAMAVRAGLSILQAARAFALELEAERGIAGFQVRVGINTGWVAAGGQTEAEDTIMGAAVNLAARLESAAPPGTMLISHDTYQQVRGLFDFQPFDPIEVKGFLEPVPVYCVLREKEHAFHSHRRGVEGVETRMIGRVAELLALQEAYYAFVEEGERRFVTIVGEAGLGKSRLLDEFESWVAMRPENVQRYHGRVRLETQRLPYGLLRALFATHFAIRDDDPADVAREKLIAGFAAMETGGGPALVAAQPEKADSELADSELAHSELAHSELAHSELAHSELAHSEMRGAFVGQLLGFDFSASPYLAAVQDDPQQIRDRSLVYLADFFRAAAAQSPLLVMLEDLHWADDSSLAAVANLALALAEQPILFIAVARPTLYERRPQWFAGEGFHRRLDLQPLSRRDSQRLVTELLQKLGQVPAALRELLVSNAEGNPFYVEELIKMLIEDGVIIKNETRWRVETAGLAAARVPPTLTGVLQARLDSLPDDERAILQQASVIGRVFWDQMVNFLNSAAENGLDEHTVYDGLLALRQRELVFRRDNSAFSGTTEHIFKHSILHDVTYESVLLRLRRAYHALAAEWLLARSSERAGEFTGLIANHLEQAGKSADALTFLRQAGDEAAGKYANEEALAYYERALALVAASDLQTRYALLLSREAVHDLLGRRPAQRGDLDALEELAQVLDEDDKRAESALRLASFLAAISDFPGAIEAAQLGISRATAAADAGKEARGHLIWGSVLWRQGDPEQALRQLWWALTTFREMGDQLGESAALNSLGLVAEAQGDTSAARGYYGEALTIAREMGDQMRESGALLNLGAVDYFQGEYATARERLEQALIINRRMGDRLGEAAALEVLGHTTFGLGNYPAAWRAYKQSLTIARETGNRVREGSALNNLAQVAEAQADFTVARSHSERSLSIFAEIGQTPEEAWALLTLARAQAGLNQWPEARATYEQAAALAEATNQSGLLAQCRAGLALIALAQGEPDAAAQIAGEIADLLEASGRLDVTLSPLRLYVACIQVFQTAGDPHWRTLLESAYKLLQQIAGKIQDETTRRTFLENVPWHRQIAALWAEQSDEPGHQN